MSGRPAALAARLRRTRPAMADRQHYLEIQ
jgi:hypothetical protein